MSELTGEVIGPYQITERLGRGGMADVYKAFHTELKIYRAIKFIRPEFDVLGASGTYTLIVDRRGDDLAQFDFVLLEAG